MCIYIYLIGVYIYIYMGGYKYIYIYNIYTIYIFTGTALTVFDYYDVFGFTCTSVLCILPRSPILAVKHGVLVKLFFFWGGVVW